MSTPHDPFASRRSLRAGAGLVAASPTSGRTGGRRPLPAMLNAPKLAPLIGGRYRVRALVARGGMGSIYAVEDLFSGESRAVKVMHAELLLRDGGARRRFVREAEMLARLRHPNCVRMLELGEERDGTLYLVMEYLQGRNVKNVLRRDGALPEARVLDIALQTCRALQEAHQLDIIHRDVKPSNLVLLKLPDGHDHVKLVDFGLGKSLQTDLREPLTHKGIYVGSLAYGAPEQLNDETAIDARVDIYGLGAAMYEMLAGRSPMAGLPVTRIVSLLRSGARVQPLDEVVDTRRISAPLAAVVMRCLEPDPDQRWRSTEALLNALEALQGHVVAMPDASGLPRRSIMRLRESRSTRADASGRAHAPDASLRKAGKNRS